MTITYASDSSENMKERPKAISNQHILLNSDRKKQRIIKLGTLIVK